MKRVLLVCALVVLTGCIFGGTESAQPDVQILLTGDVNVKSSHFSYQGDVVAEAHRTNEVYVFNNVSIVLYDRDKQAIASHKLGTLTTKPGNPITVSIESNEMPAYVVVESPDFWNKSIPVEVSALVKTDSKYRDYWITSEDEKFDT